MKEPSLKQRILRGGAIAFAGRIGAALTGVLLNAVLARLLSPEDMGAYFIAFNLATFLAIWGRFGTEYTALRLIAESIKAGDERKAKRVIYLALVVTFLGSLLIGIVVYAGLGQWLVSTLFSSAALGSVINLLAVWPGMLAFQGLFAEIFRGFHAVGFSALFNGLLASALGAVLLGLLWISKNDAGLPLTLAIILCASSVSLLLAGLLLLYRISAIKPGSGNNTLSLSNILHNSWPLFVNQLFMFGLTQSGILIVGIGQTEAHAALYGAAMRLIFVLSLVVSILNAVLPPMIAELNFDNRKEQLSRLLQGTATLGAIPGLLVLSAFMLFGDKLLILVFGDFYGRAYPILIVLSIGRVISVLGGFGEFTLMMTGNTRPIMKVSIISTCVSIVLAFALVSDFGALGVAAAFAIAVTLQQILLLIYIRKYCGIWVLAKPQYVIEAAKYIRQSRRQT